MADVFISYSHRDRDYAHRLADELRCHQIDVWIDDRIDYGDEWPRTIQQNLTACRTFIVIMSTNAFNSMWVQNEVSYAQATHKTIFPLLLEGQVWLSMAAMQYVDVRAGELPPSRFYQKVQNSLNPLASRVPERRAMETTAIPNMKERLPGTRKRSTGLFVAGSLLVFAVIAGIAYIVFPWDGEDSPPPTAVIVEPTEPAISPGMPEVPPTEWPAITETLPTEEPPMESPTQVLITESPPPTEAPIQIPVQPTVTATPFGGGLGQIAFISERDGNAEGFLANSNGMNAKNVTNNPAAEESISLSPDGKMIIFHSNRGGNTDVYVADTDGSNQRRLTDAPAIDGGARWSPDGTRIAFSSERDGNWEIYLMNADGSGQTRLTNNPTEDFVTGWSPDSAWIAFVSTRAGNWEIYVMKIDGSLLIRVTENTADDGEASFSPDSTRVVFHSNRDGNWEIYSADTHGSGLIRLTENSANDLYPSWSPDGKLIAFGSDRDGDYEIYAVKVDGSEVFKLTENTDTDRNPTW